MIIEKITQDSDLDLFESHAQAMIAQPTLGLSKSSITCFHKELHLDLQQAFDTPAKFFFLQVMHDGQFVGFLQGLSEHAGVATLKWLLITPSYHSRGLGAKLLQHSIDMYRTNKSIHKVKLHAINERARKFYLKQGWQEEGFHPNHWYKQSYWTFGLEL